MGKEEKKLVSLDVREVANGYTIERDSYNGDYDETYVAHTPEEAGEIVARLLKAGK